MKSVIVFTSMAVCIIASSHALAQQGNKNVQLKDLGVQNEPKNPNVISGPLDPVPPKVPTVQQQMNDYYQKSQSEAGPTIITKQPATGEKSIGVGISAPISGSGITPSTGKASKQ